MNYVNINKLKGKIVEKDMTVTSLAEKIGVDRATLYRKLDNGGAGLTVKDANNIAVALDLSYEESMSIFFARYVA